MNAVLDWVKANVFIVVFALLMVAAAVTLPIFSSRLNSTVRAQVADRAKLLSQLGQLEKTEMLPGQRGIPNEATFRRYEEVAKVASDDAANVQRKAIEHNRKDRDVVMKEMFPQPPQALAETLPIRFHQALMDAYGGLLREVNAGSPPALDSMRQDLDVVRKTFVNQDLKKDLTEKLEPEEEKQLTERLSNARMAMCVEAAETIGLYASTDELNVPAFVQASPPSVGEMFNWQWQYWIASDVLKALHEANRADAKVHRAPVKRVLALRVIGLPGPTDASANPAGGMSGPGGASGFGGFGESPAAPPAAAQPPAGGATPAAPADSKAPAPRNYAVSHTGRVSNHLYDVINVELDLVVETSRLPQILDALATYNFMTVTGMSITVADPFEALHGGFFYGQAPVSEVHLTIETIWLREWTRQFMPASIKQSLGIAGAGAPGAPPADT